MFKEKDFEDFVAILLVLVAAAENSIGSHDAGAEGLPSVVFVDGAVLLVDEYFVGFGDFVEFGEVHADLL